MGKNNKKDSEEHIEIKGKKVSSPLPSFGLAEDVLGPDFIDQKGISQDRETEGNDANSVFHDDGMMKYVTFFLQDEEYALPISKVQEIMRIGEITRVPNSPEYVKGVMNLRGRIIPVIELKKRLSLGESVIDKNSRIVVVENGIKLLGLMVDQVAQVMNITAEQIDQAPDEVIQIQESYIKGIGKIDNRMIIMLDLEQIIV